MKKILFASVLVALGSSSALAADMAPHMQMKTAPVVTPVSAWQGFYVGGNLGYGWGNGNTDVAFLPTPVAFNLPNTTLDASPRGVLGGAQIGYIWQMGSIAAGLEADIQGSGLKGSASKGPLTTLAVGNVVAGSFTSTKQELTWFGTIRGRLGTTITPDLLIYGTGGFAYGQVHNETDTIDTGPEFVGTQKQVKTGWTAGGGAEWMFARNWSAKAEYLYLDLGKVSAIGLNPIAPGFGVKNTWRTQDHIVRAGVNYHF